MPIIWCLVLAPEMIDLENKLAGGLTLQEFPHYHPRWHPHIHINKAAASLEITDQILIINKEYYKNSSTVGTNLRRIVIMRRRNGTPSVVSRPTDLSITCDCGLG